MTRDELKRNLEEFATGLTIMADRDAKDDAVAGLLRKVREALEFRVETDLLEHTRGFDPQRALLDRERAARIRRTTGELRPVESAGAIR
jgi:hypothetical protein